MKSYEMFVHYKQGDDLGHHLENSKDASESLFSWSTSLISAGERVKVIAERIKGLDITIDADTHFIGMSGDHEEVLNLMVADGLLNLVEFEE
jgi:hypothetical protein